MSHWQAHTAQYPCTYGTELLVPHTELLFNCVLHIFFWYTFKENRCAATENSMELQSDVATRGTYIRFDVPEHKIKSSWPNFRGKHHNSFHAKMLMLKILSVCITEGATTFAYSQRYLVGIGLVALSNICVH